MANPKVTIGPYVMGEKPAPLTYQFLDSAGAPINLTGWTAKFSYQEHDGPAVTANAAITDGPNGKATYTFSGAEFYSAGRYRAQMWVGNTANRFASVDIDFNVAVSVGAAPNI
jgi:hypothetical protein